MKGRTKGKDSGKPITLFIANLFVINEELADAFAKGKKDAKGRPVMPLTNDQLKRAIAKEYGHEDTTMESMASGNQSIEKFRIEYHKGMLARAVFPADHPGKPAIFSFRYNEEGQRISTWSRSGNHPVTNGEIREMIKKFPLVRETEDAVRKRLGRNPRKWKEDDATE